jgi:hypothetical protein
MKLANITFLKAAEYTSFEIYILKKIRFKFKGDNIYLIEHGIYMHLLFLSFLIPYL